MNIAIIDDIADDRRILANHLNTYMAEHKIAFQKQEFSSAEDFFDHFREIHFNLVFLDIYMNGMNGMEAAQKLYKLDKNCKIIFLTTSVEHAQMSYSVHAVYYLMKPVNQVQFEQAMDFCNLKPDYPVPFLSLTIDGIDRQIDTEQILYIDYQSRRVHIHFSDHFITLNKGFSEVAELLKPDDRFLTIFRGVMVNMQHIAGCDDIFFILDNGKHLQITIRNKKAIIQAYRNYVFNHMGG